MYGKNLQLLRSFATVLCGRKDHCGDSSFAVVGELPFAGMNFVAKEGNDVGADPGLFHFQDKTIDLTATKNESEAKTRKLSKMTIIHSSKSAKMRRTMDWRMPDAGPTPSGRNLGRKSPHGVDTERGYWN